MSADLEKSTRIPLRPESTMYNLCGMSPHGSPRELRFNVVMTSEERQMLDELAKADSRTAGDWVRVAIRTAHATKFGKGKVKR